jgi:hypothetical protein
MIMKRIDPTTGAPVEDELYATELQRQLAWPGSLGRA